MDAALFGEVHHADRVTEDFAKKSAPDIVEATPGLLDPEVGPERKE